MELQMENLQAHNLGVKKGMKRSRCPSAKVERKIIEKNRRNHMKNLYSMLNSLLPHRNSSKEPLSLPDQIDEAVSYIKSLQTRLKESREKKESLMGRKRSSSNYRCTTNNTSTTAAGAETIVSLKAPEIRINEKGSALEVALITGPVDSQFMFYEMIRILHEDGAQVLNASFSVVESTVFHIVHAEIGATGGAQILKEKLKQFVNGSTGCSEEELQEELWDYEIQPETWNFPIM